MLRAIYKTHGPPVETIELEDIDIGPPGPGECLVRVEAAPVHIADLKYIEGTIEIAPEPPAVAGIEGVGRVEDCSADVREIETGQRVLLPRRGETFAQLVRVRADQLVPVVDHGDPVQISLVPINAATSYMLLTGVVHLSPGEWFIQNAANSSCGRFNIGIGAKLGMRSINIVRREELIEDLEGWGADVVLMDGEDLHERVAEATGGAPIRLAIDAVAGQAVTRLARCLTTGGVIANYGLLSGEPCSIPPDLLFLHNLRLQGFFLNHFEPERYGPEWRAMMQQLAAWVADGELRAKIAATYPLREIKAALAHEMETGAQREGKVIVLPNA